MCSTPSPSTFALAPILSCLGYLGWIGFPLRPASSGQESAFVCTFRDWLKIALIFVVAVTAYALPYWFMSSQGRGFDAFWSLSSDLGFSAVDVVTYVTVLAIAFANHAFVFYKLAVGKRKLSALFARLGSVCTTIDEGCEDAGCNDASIRDLGKASLRRVVWSSAWAFLASLVSVCGQMTSIYFMYTMLFDHVPLVVTILTVVLMTMANNTVAYGGAVVGSEIVVAFFPCFIADLLTRFVKRLKDPKSTSFAFGRKQTGDPLFVVSPKGVAMDDSDMKRSAFDRLFKASPSFSPNSKTTKTDPFGPGLLLCDLVEESSSSFASLYLSQFSSCTLLSTLSLYSASAVLFSGGAKTLALSNTVTFLFFGLHFVLRMVGSAHFGQVLDDACRAARSDVAAFVYSRLDADVAAEDRLDEKQRYAATMLMDRLERITPMQPYSYFSVNRATLVAAGSVILTYLIILVQFKDETAATIGTTSSNNNTVAAG